MNAFFIIPASVKQAGAELFMDHPPLEKRLAALAEIALADVPAIVGSIDIVMGEVDR
jgi:Zn-dependent protease with chaperone function